MTIDNQVALEFYSQHFYMSYLLPCKDNDLLKNKTTQKKKNKNLTINSGIKTPNKG